MLFAFAAWADSGAETYDRLCKSCHGADGKGNEAKAKILKIDAERMNLGRAEAAGRTKEQTKDIVSKGKDKMPAYEKKLKPEEIDPVVEYAMGLAKAARGK